MNLSTSLIFHSNVMDVLWDEPATALPSFMSPLSLVLPLIDSTFHAKLVLAWGIGLQDGVARSNVLDERKGKEEAERRASEGRFILP